MSAHGLDTRGRHSAGQRHRPLDRLLPRSGWLPSRSRHSQRVHARRAADSTRVGMLDRLRRPAGAAAMAPGSMTGLQLVVADAAAARDELLARGIEASETTVFDERDGGTFFGFDDPDGNSWAVQQLKVRAAKPLIPVEARGRFADG